MRAIISGGGTGGHIFPAIAIANAIKQKDPKAEILFVGAIGRMEMEKVPQAGYRIEGLPIMGIQRRLTLQNLKVPFKVIASLLKARSIIKNFKPDIAIGVGGYASGPLLRMASLAGIPTVIQEQNSYPGVTNKILAKKAQKICVAYDKMENFFPADKIVITGNPVRQEVWNIQGKRERAMVHFGLNANKPVVLIIGGSLGARTINQSIEKHAAAIVQTGAQLLWQTGKNFQSSKHHDTSTIKIHTFIKEMDLAYASADIIISRAGAMSISELCLIKKPCILVPSPNVAEDHQTKNAMALVNKNAAILIRDAEAIDKLGKETIHLLSDTNKQKELSAEIAKLGKPNADIDIVSQIFNIVQTAKS